MTQEDKELLLKDICVRLPYMPKIKIIYQQQGIKGTDEGNVSCDAIEHIVNDLRNGVITDMQIYLRPISSLNKEELTEYIQILLNTYKELSHGNIFSCIEVFDYLNSIHVDYRNLIEKGLAIEVTEENNPYKE